MPCTCTIKMSKIWLLAYLIIFSFTITAQVGIANEDPKTMLDINGAISFRKGGSLELSAGLNHNVSLGSIPYSFYVITGPAGDFSISGFDVGTSEPDGHVVFLQNATDYKMTLLYLNDASSAANRLFISNNQDIVIPGQYATFSLQYSSALLGGKWWLTGAMNLVDDLEFDTPVGEGLGPGDSKLYKVLVPGVGIPPSGAKRVSSFTVSIVGPTSGNEINDLTIEYKEARDKFMYFRVKNNSTTANYNFTKYRVLVFR